MEKTLEISGMKFHSYHGCLPVERQKGADYLVDFECSYDFSQAAADDDLSKTIDMAGIRKIVAGQMETPCNLLETVVSRISDAISEEFPQLENFSVRVSKLNPPVGGECRSSAAKIRK